MAKKPDFTEQQIVQYLLSGGTVEELSKNSKVTTNQILSAIVNNPAVFTSLRGQAEEQSAGLAMFDPKQTYTAPDEYILAPNKYNVAYEKLNPRARELAFGYMNQVKKEGDNPAVVDSLREKWTKVGVDNGMDPDEVDALITKFESEKGDWFAQENAVEIANRTAQFKAYEKQRKELDLQTGDNPLYAAMSKLTGGYGKLADVINPDVTWEQFAKKRAPKNEITSVRQAEKELATPEQGKKRSKKEKDFVQGYLNVVAKKLPKGQTPFQTDVKKLLPYLQSNNPFGK